MNPAGWLSDEEKEALKAEIRKMKAQEFRDETWTAIAQLLKNQNWLMDELMKTQADVGEARNQVNDVVGFLREVAEVDVVDTTNH